MTARKLRKWPVREHGPGSPVWDVLVRGHRVGSVGSAWSAELQRVCWWADALGADRSLGRAFPGRASAIAVLVAHADQHRAEWMRRTDDDGEPVGEAQRVCCGCSGPRAKVWVWAEACPLAALDLVEDGAP